MKEYNNMFFNEKKGNSSLIPLAGIFEFDDAEKPKKRTLADAIEDSFNEVFEEVINEQDNKKTLSFKNG